jgi:hypothetical protein
LQREAKLDHELRLMWLQGRVADAVHGRDGSLMKVDESAVDGFAGDESAMDGSMVDGSAVDGSEYRTSRL